MVIMSLIAISYCINNPQRNSFVEISTDSRLRRFLYLQQPCPCLYYGKPCQCLCLCIMLICIQLLSGCSTTSMRHGSYVKTAQYPQAGRELAAIARSLLGVPYQWGGNSSNGLDCSGLVEYAHLKVGISVPRNSQDQLTQASPVRPSNLHPGDLVFFKMSWRNKASHVGIYAGNGRFIHAPSSGKRVSYASLQNPYWKERLVAAGRFY